MFRCVARFQVTNWLEGSASDIARIAIVEESIPVVYGESPVNTPGGPGVFVFVKADVDLPCGNDSVVSYMWKEVRCMIPVANGLNRVP